MKVQLKFFSILRGRFGVSEKEIEIQGPKEAREIFYALFEDRTVAEGLIRFTRFAVNGEYVPVETLVQDGNELAFIPPVSGG